MTAETAGSYTLSGFSNALEAGAFDSHYSGPYFLIDRYDNDDGGGGSYDYNFRSSALSGPQVITASSTSSDNWSLSLTITSSTATPTHSTYDYIEYNNYAKNAGADNGNTHTLTFTGTGATNLQTLIQGVAESTGAQANDTFGVTFDLVDGSGAFTGISGANESVFTTYFEASPACYISGTEIAGPAGPIRVESLKAGDLVITADGRTLPVKWIGRRRYSAAQVAANPQLRPVLIRRGALANDVPRQDLSVSPMHGMYIDHVFIPAVALVNGATILRSDVSGPLAYFHVELDQHCVLLANGAPAESYADDDSRLMFDNADEYYDLFGTGPSAGFSAPRLEQGQALQAIGHRMMARAGLPPEIASSGPLRGHVERLGDGLIEGWILDESGTAPIELEVICDDTVVASGLANRYRADLDHAGLADGSCAFRIELPPGTNLSLVKIRRRGDRTLLQMPATLAVAA